MQFFLVFKKYFHKIALSCKFRLICTKERGGARLCLLINFKQKQPNLPVLKIRVNLAVRYECVFAPPSESELLFFLLLALC